MLHIVNKLFGKLQTSLKYATNLPAYLFLLQESLSSIRIRKYKCNPEEDEINKLLKGYPRNHNYMLCLGKIIPSYRLFNRLKIVEKLYSNSGGTFLDVGCCRGFYVLDAVLNKKYFRGVGIDVFPPFIYIANSVKKSLHSHNTSFYISDLARVACNLKSFGGPFDTVLCIGTYHYMYWGSQRSPIAYMQHRTILKHLWAVCKNRVILSARLEVSRLPKWLQARATKSDRSREYNLPSFIKEAEKLFHVTRAGNLEKDPLFVMLKNE